MPDDGSQSKVADTVLKISALVSVAAVVSTVGYNYFLCADGTWRAIFSVPVFLLALAIFGIALGLTDSVFGTFRDIDIWAGKPFRRLSKAALYGAGWFCELSLGIVITYALVAAAQVPICVI